MKYGRVTIKLLFPLQVQDNAGLLQRQMVENKHNLQSAEDFICISTAACKVKSKT